MDSNLWLYANGRQQYHAAYSLIVFGAENFKRANIIKGLPKPETNNKLMQLGLEYDRMGFVQEFICDYVIDCIRILMFFEGYMKAELIKEGFCVHNIDAGGAVSYRNLAKEQRLRPITLGEINVIEPFVIDEHNEVITNKCVKVTTLGINILLSPQYRAYYQFDDFIVDAVRHFNNTRNNLRFNTETELQLSSLFVERLRRINHFVDATIEKWKATT